MMMNYRLLAVLLVSAFVVSPSVVENAFAKTKKKLTYEQAWQVCKKEMDKMGIFGTGVQANERHTRGAACMKKHGYRI
ncbi:MAG TPA: hypothetical protein VFP60_19770 [Pseudolabrys sp.]|nr:hypothetical protein [Pseudolabrys sp.]